MMFRALVIGDFFSPQDCTRLSTNFDIHVAPTLIPSLHIRLRHGAKLHHGAALLARERFTVTLSAVTLLRRGQQGGVYEEDA